MLSFETRVRRRLTETSGLQACLLVRIASRGGETDAGAALHQILRAFPLPVITAAYGAISSAGVIAFCSGERRLVLEGTRVTLHAPQWTPDGSYSVAEMRRVLAIAESRLATAVRILTSATGVDGAVISRDLDIGRSFTGVEAVDAGLATALASTITFTPLDC